MPRWPSAIHSLPGLPRPDGLMRHGVLRAQADRVDIACDHPGAFTLGSDSAAGEVRTAGAAHGHPLEVFNAPALPCFEIESHSAAITLPPGERTAFTVEESVQRLIPVNEEGAHT
jgi:hypothetical protein